MRRTEQNKGRVFLLTFALAALLLSLIMVGTVLAVQPTMPQNHTDELPAQEPSYRPAASESLTMAIIGKNASGGASDFLLIRFNPQYGQVPLAVLPPETLVPYKGETMTLARAWARGGGNGVKQALSERFGITVDRYAALSRDIFIRIADKTGSVVFEMPYAVSYHSDGYDINIPAGRRRLDGRDVADLFAAPSLEGGPVERAALLGELTAAIVNQNIDSAGKDVSPGLFKFIVNLVDTDLSYVDFELRRDAADFLSQLGDISVAGSLAPSGTLMPDSLSFELSEDYVSTVRKYFGASS